MEGAVPGLDDTNTPAILCRHRHRSTFLYFEVLISRQSWFGDDVPHVRTGLDETEGRTRRHRTNSSTEYCCLTCRAVGDCKGEMVLHARSTLIASLSVSLPPNRIEI